MDIGKQILFIEENGSEIEKARLGQFFYGARPAPEAIQPFTELQKRDSGFTRDMLWGNPSASRKTANALSWLDDLGRLRSRAADKDSGYLLAVQEEDEEGHVATLTLNRSEASNNLTAETFYELRHITARLRERESVWVVIVQGRGRHFSTGIDVNMVKERLDMPEDANRRFLLGLQECLDDFEALEKPTIAKLHGFCIGGGLILALCCDLRIASQRAVFILPEVRLGLAVIMGTHRVTRVAGVAAAKEMILLGERFNAATAQRYGLVHQVVPPAELDGAVAALAGKLCRLPPRTVGIAKRIINRGQDLSPREGQDLEIDAQAELFDSADLREAVASFLAGREPRFSGA
jgi:enoyl-CoA hydratase